jgi:hypothetical protein
VAGRILFFLTIVLVAKANGSDVFSPESEEVFVPQKGSNEHSTGFNEATMVMAYSCNRGAKEEAILLYPSRCMQDSKAWENIVQRTIVFVPTPDEHEHIHPGSRLRLCQHIIPEYSEQQ